MPASRFQALQRLSLLRQAFVATKTVDPKLVPLLAGVCLAILAICVILGVVTGHPFLGSFVGVTLALLVGLVIFGRRTSVAQLGMIEGKPGAAAAVLQSTRGWRVTPAVAFTRKQDFVHRAVGRGGIVLVGEGAPARVSSLLKQERRRIGRVAGDTPVHEVSVGNGQGQIPLRSLQAHLTKMPRSLKPAAVTALDTKLKALSDNDLPLPKGPMPRAKRRQ
jgi:type IV secretory pathway TrbL component